MSVPLTVAGVTFNYPQEFDKRWGPTLTNWSTAVTNVLAGVTAGSFAVVKSQETNIALTGFLRLGNSSPGIVWRNAANLADLPLTVNASNQLTFNGTPIGATVSLTDGHIFVGNVSNQPADVAMTGDVTITNAGVTAIGALKVVNAQIATLAGITLSKLASTSPYFWYAADSAGVLSPLGVTASKAVITDANGLPSASGTTSTELGYLSGVLSPVQTQLSARLPLSGGIMSGLLNMGSNKITSITSGTGTGEAIQYGQWVGGNTPGSTTNDSALAGNIGQYVQAESHSVVNAAATTVFDDLLSLTLSAGDWDIDAAMQVASGGIATEFYYAVTAYPGNDSTGVVKGQNYFNESSNSGGLPLAEFAVVFPRMRVSLGGSTTYYLKRKFVYTSSTPLTFGGILSARRMR